jgi:hypothetical protein
VFGGYESVVLGRCEPEHRLIMDVVLGGMPGLHT